MSKKTFEIVELRLDKIVGGGQALGTLDDGRKLFAWGGLPGERVKVQLTKKKSSFAEGIVIEVLEPSPERIAPEDPESYLSTSPWQIMSFEAEQHHKIELIREAFTLHNANLPENIDIYSDGQRFHYRNKVEFSWYGDTISGVDTLDLAFFRRGSKGKIVIEDSALLPPEIVQLAHAIRDHLRSINVSARQLKTLLIRCDAAKNCVWQLYVKDTPCDFAESLIQDDLPAQGGEVIYSNPKSPASVITERLAHTGNIVLTDTILGVPFRYATEGFFQVNLPVYEQALNDMNQWVALSTSSPPSPLSPLLSSQLQAAARKSLSAGPATESAPTFEKSEISSKAGAAPLVVTRLSKNSIAQPLATSFSEDSAFPAGARQDQKQLAPSGSGEKDGGEKAATKKRGVLDLYSGVGSIGLTIGGPDVTLVESNEHAVREMKRNIEELGISATPVLAASEQALEHITEDKIVIVDPPRAGLHADVVDRLLETKPSRIIYLSCNPVTQARDVALLSTAYTLRHYKGYNFFPSTPHIEGLAILDVA